MQSSDSKIFRLSISAERSSIAAASSWLQDICSGCDVSHDEINRLDICLNEVLANIVSHGGVGATERPIELKLTLHDKDGFRIVELKLTDAGLAFDPTSNAPQPSATSLTNAQPGGLGVVMLRANADKLDYQYVEGLNNLTIAVMRSSKAVHDPR
ncbi:MAG: ATP-binding protein [Rhodoferax sp.]|nr:ATP-binding protein [Rhodoferax sp.]